MRDPQIPAPDLLAALEAEQQRLWEFLASADSAALTQRRPNGDWSVIENLRHLLFAEQAHLGSVMPERPPLSPLGRPPPGLQAKLFPKGMTPSTDAAEVIAAWREAHAVIRPHLLDDTPKARRELSRNLRHLRNHIKLIQRQLRAHQKLSRAEQ
jgi:hypothetical protein